MSFKVDYHIHTNYSDGSMSPSEIVRKYKDENYDKIAITDHDTVDGVGEALSLGKLIGMDVVTGIEFSTVYSGKTDFQNIEMHILGYGLDIYNDKLLAKLKELRLKRVERNDKLFKVLKDMGYTLTFEEVAANKKGYYIGKPDFGRAMVRRGYICSPSEIFTPGKYLESPEAKAVKKEMVDTVEAIELILEAGGTAVLAHPIQIRKIGEPGSEEFYANLQSLVEDLKKAGLGGMECYHPDHNSDNMVRFAAIAEKNKLCVTEGSDYHGTDFVKKQK